MAEPDVEALIRELLEQQAGEKRVHAPDVGPSIPRVYTTSLFDGPPSHLALEILALRFGRISQSTPSFALTTRHGHGGLPRPSAWK